MQLSTHLTIIAAMATGLLIGIASMDTTPQTEQNVPVTALAHPDRIAALLDANPRQYRQPTRQAYRQPEGMSAKDAEAAYHARQAARECGTLELGCMLDGVLP